MKATQKTWEKLGEEAPYYSVLVADAFKPENLSAGNLAAFFDSGRQHVARLMDAVGELRPDFKPRTTLDFGCGVARVTIPLAEISGTVIAVDISKPMLLEAHKNCEERYVNNVRFMTTQEFLHLPDFSVDFLHSFIVLQHISNPDGYALIGKLISVLEKGGIGAIQVTFCDRRSAVRRLLSWIKIHVPGAAQLHNLLRGQAMSCPAMQMNTYRLDRLFKMLYEAGCHKVLTRFSDHGTHLGLLLIFEKSSLEPF